MLGIALARPEFAYAGRFDTLPADYGALVNSKRQQEGSHFRFRLAVCTAVTPWSVASSHRILRLSRQVERSRLGSTATPTDVALADAFVTLAATMTIFDPTVQAQQREALTTLLAEFVHSNGYGESDRIMPTTPWHSTRVPTVCW